jgi:hypothetical protein
VSKALSAISEPTRGRFVRTWIGHSRGANGKTKVTLVLEPLPPTPGMRRDEVTSVSVIAASAEGEVYFRGQVPDKDAAATNGAALDSDDREVVVPDLTTTDVAFATPKVFVARNALEFRALAKNPDASPTADRDFRRTDRLVVRAEAYAPGNALVKVAAKLLNKQGQALADVPISAPAAPTDPHVVDLPLASLAPGEYLLELSAAAEGASAATQLIPFRVSG